jgi:hypothetical protein
MDERAFQIHFAKVHLSECRARRHHPANRSFYWFLFASAQASRRRAASVRPEPMQGGLFA